MGSKDIILYLPIYIVTGFIESGKTTFLNKLLNDCNRVGTASLLIQFESGEIKFTDKYGNVDVMTFSKKDVEQHKDYIISTITDFLNQYRVDEIWVEWNGMLTFSVIKELFSNITLSCNFRIMKVIHIIDAERLDSLLGRTGAALPEQIYNSNIAVIRNTTGNGPRHVQKIIRSMSPGVKIYGIKDTAKIRKEIYSKNGHPLFYFCFSIVSLIIIFWVLLPHYFPDGIFETKLVNVFLGIILQAVPFLTVGVLISSAIQIFIPKNITDYKFPKSTGAAMMCCILSGFFLPVCDCASVPVFHSLVKKGVPLPAAIAFLTAAPVVNPVSIMSTYYAFNRSFYIAIIRVGIGILSSILIGIFFILRPSGKEILQGCSDGIMCNCGYCGNSLPTDTKIKTRIDFFLKHSRTEFFGVFRYLLVGSFISALIQAIGIKPFQFQNGAGFALSLFLMMFIAFILSLCSSSDAIVARSLCPNFSLGAVMGFLVFGPMMDIKNILMLSSRFSKKFVWKLLLFTFIGCYIVIFALARPLLAGR